MPRNTGTTGVPQPVIIIHDTNSVATVPQISPVDWNEGPEEEVPVARNPCDEGTAFLSGLPPPRRLVCPRRRTGFAFEAICL